MHFVKEQIAKVERHYTKTNLCMLTTWNMTKMTNEQHFMNHKMFLQPSQHQL